MMKTISISTQKRNQMLDITNQVASEVSAAGKDEGLCVVSSPHTTGAITVNEGHDPDVTVDLLAWLEKLVPRSSQFLHSEGNSDAHIKVSLIGPSVTIPISAGRLALGTWQRIFFCEFDGPRKREYIVTVI